MNRRNFNISSGRASRSAVRLMAVVALCLAASWFAPSPAGAVTANGGVYGIVAKRDGWCSSPRIAWVNETTGQSGTDYSGSDDIFWLPVRLGSSNRVTMAVYCGAFSRSWVGSIKPTRNKQSVFFRYPSGHTIK